MAEHFYVLPFFIITIYFAFLFNKIDVAFG